MTIHQVSGTVAASSGSKPETDEPTAPTGGK
jgi:hypothetical protein